MRILVSACLMGTPCRYDGGSTPLPKLRKLMQDHTCIPICPETLGGLPTPRPRAERRGGEVFTEDGTDVTEQYIKGALEVLRLYKLYKCKAVVLKSKSPSCGIDGIYDGTFTGTLTDADGITAQILRAKGIPVYDENHLEPDIINERPPFYSI